MSYEIKLPQFEGPFDLLLFFIERDELDIYDIPIARITNDFLDYIKKMGKLNIETASEFILVAATLMHIKARMLLPRKDMDEGGNEIDPRQELVEKLLEYKLYKEFANELKSFEEQRTLQFKRGNINTELFNIAEHVAVESELQSVTLYKLLQAFNKSMKTYNTSRKKTQHLIYKYPYTTEKEKNYLLNILKKQKKGSFDSIFQKCKDKIHAIFTFLALLELIQENLLFIKTRIGYNNFIVTSK